MSKFDLFSWSGCTFPTSYIKSLFALVEDGDFKNILEVGFDTGSSSLALLRACPNATMLSIDIQDCPVGRQLIESSEVRERHIFIEADSRGYLRQLSTSNRKFDLIYIDGDHLYDVAKSDIYKAEALLQPGGIMIVDDADPNHQHFGVGRAVNEFCAERGFRSVRVDGNPNYAVVLTKIND